MASELVAAVKAAWASREEAASDYETSVRDLDTLRATAPIGDESAMTAWGAEYASRLSLEAHLRVTLAQAEQAVREAIAALED